MFAKVRYPKAYEAKHLKAHEPAKHLRTHGPAQHLKAPDFSKTPAWAVVIAGTGVAVTLVGATTGQFHTTIKPNQSAVPQKSTSNSAVRQLLNATNSASASLAMAKPSLSYAVHQARSGRAIPQASPAKTSTSTAGVSSTALSPAHMRDERLAASSTRLAAAGGMTAPSTTAPAPTTVPAPTTAVHAAALGLSGPALTPGAPATTLLVPTTTPAQPTTTMDQPSSMVAAPLRAADQATYSSDHPSDGHGRSWRHWGGTGASTATAGPVGTVATPAVGTAAALAVGTTLPEPGPAGEEATGAPASPSIAPVGAPIIFSGDLGGATSYELSVSPQSAGDLLVLTVINDGWPNSVSAVSGGGVSQWSEASSPYLDAADGQTLQVWYGVVTTAGPSQVDVTWTGAVQNVDLGLQELNAGTDPTWSLDDVGFSNEPFPSLSGPASDEAFEDRGRVERGFVARDSHVAFSGGPGGIRYQPRPEERVAEHERHTSVTSYQQQHDAAARSDRCSYVKNNGGHPSTLAVPRPLGANKNAAPSADRGKSGHDNWNAPTKSQGPGVGAKPQGPGAGKEGVLNYNSPKSNTGNAVGQPRTMGGSSPKGDTTVKGSGVPQNNMHTMPPAHTESQPHPQGQQFQPRSQGQQHEAPATHFTPPAHTESQPHPQGQQLQPHSQGQQHEAPSSHSAPKDKDEHKHN